jgi:hypothetical protein
MDLIVIEPPVQVEEPEQPKQALSYSISIRVSPVFSTSTDGTSPPPPLGKDDRDHGGPSRCRQRDPNPSDFGASSANAWGPAHVPLRQGAVDSHVANPDEGMEAVAPVSMVSTVASIEDLAVAVITPSLGREKNMILGIVALLHNYMASLPDCLANSLVPVSPLPTLEKQARSDSEKGSTSPSMPPHPGVVFERGDVIAAEVPAANTGQL